MAKPDELPRWNTDAVHVTRPSDGEMDTGYTANQVPASDKSNWLFGKIYQWLKWLDDGVWTAVSLALTGALAVVDVIASGSVTGASLHFTTPVTKVIQNSLAWEDIPTHQKGTGQYIYAASANPVYWPLVGLRAGDHVTQVVLDFAKNTGAGCTNHYDIVKFIGGVESSVTGAPGADSTVGPVAIGYARTGDYVVGAGELWYFKLTPGNSIAPAADRSYDLTLAFKRP